MFSKTDIERYFTAEKQRNRQFILLGLGAVGHSFISFFIVQSDVYKGMAIPFFILGTLLTVVGFSVYKKSDKLRIANVKAYDMNPGKLKELELPRMRKVMKNFIYYRTIEIVLSVIGVGLFIFFIRDFRHEFWKGVGFALAFMAILTLIFDHFSEKRGYMYTKGLESLAG